MSSSLALPRTMAEKVHIVTRPELEAGVWDPPFSPHTSASLGQQSGPGSHIQATHRALQVAGKDHPIRSLPPEMTGVWQDTVRGANVCEGDRQLYGPGL